MHRLPIVALILFLSTTWWGDLVKTTAEALGLKALTATEQPAPPPPTRPGPTTDGGCEVDPNGCPEGQ